MDFKVSVIIPVYNAEQFLRKTVESALACPEVKQIVLVEDGSPDNSIEICKELSLQYDIVEYHQHPDKGNHGAGASRTLAVEKCKMPFTAFLDADDYYLENRFEITQNVFRENPDADGVYEAIGVYYYSESAKQKYNKEEITTVKNRVEPAHFFKEFLTGGGYVSLDGITVKTEFLRSLGPFDAALRQTQDTDMILRMAWKGKMYPGSIEKPVTNRGVHDENRIHDRKKALMYKEMLSRKWVKIMAKNNFPQDQLYTMFFRLVNSANSIIKNNEKVISPNQNRLNAIKCILKDPMLLTKLNIKDLVYGFRSGFL